MELIGIIKSILIAIGGCTVTLFLYYIVTEEIKPRVKTWWKRTNKIQFLCKHEYKVKHRWDCCDYYEWELECVNCGAEKKIYMLKEGWYE